MTTRDLILTAWDCNLFWQAAILGVLVLYGFLCRWKFSRKSVFFIAGLVLAFLALASPIGLLARGYLFSAHMFQHFLLVLIVPPLLLLGLPPARNRNDPPRRLKLSGNYPLIAWFSGVGAMWIWHVPAFCDAAVSYGTVRLLQVSSLLFLGILFWRPLVGPRMEDRISPLVGILYLFSACIACTLLGVWITFAPVGICPVFMDPVDRSGIMTMIHKEWGLTPAADQQIGGLLMWVPACLVYLGAILALLDRFYRRPQKVLALPIKKTEKKNARKK